MKQKSGIKISNLLAQVIQFSDRRPFLFVLYAFTCYFGAIILTATCLFVLGIQGSTIGWSIFFIQGVLTVFLTPLMARSWLKVFGAKIELLEDIFFSIYRKRN